MPVKNYKHILSGGKGLLILYWLVIFILYYPARNAGFVSDFTDWLKSIRQDRFADYINRTHFQVKSLYQVTQFHTWLVYQLFGTSRIAWHLLFVSFHAVNCLLLFLFTRRLFTDAAIRNASSLAALCGLLYAVCPYVSEVVVWEPSFHYLQAVCIILLILYWTQQYLHQPRPVYIILSLVLFFISTFTHELFYLTPWLVLGLCLGYRYAFNYDKKNCNRLLLLQFVPMILLFGLHLVIFAAVYGRRVSHVGTSLLDKPWQSYAIKAPYYVFHLSVLGRMWPEEIKQHVYVLLRSPAVAVAVYALLAFITVYPALRFRKLNGYSKLVYGLWLALVLSVLIYVPMWIPDKHMVTGDRYTYLMLVFWIPVVVLLVNGTGMRRLTLLVFAVLVCINGVLTCKLSQRWGNAARIVNALQNQLKPTPGKVGIMLSIPASLHGIPMLGSSRAGEVRLMHNLLFEPKIEDSLLDVASFNMMNEKDGAHVFVLNDSTLYVFTNRKNEKWFRNYVLDLYNYETPYYKVQPHPDSNYYTLILKQPVSSFVLYYVVGDTLKTVNPALSSVNQY